MFTTVEFTAPLHEVKTFRNGKQEFEQLFKILRLSPTAKTLII